MNRPILLSFRAGSYINSFCVTVSVAAVPESMQLHCLFYNANGTDGTTSITW